MCLSSYGCYLIIFCASFFKQKECVKAIFKQLLFLNIYSSFHILCSCFSRYIRVLSFFFPLHACKVDPRATVVFVFFSRFTSTMSILVLKSWPSYIRVNTVINSSLVLISDDMLHYFCRTVYQFIKNILSIDSN